MNHLKLKTPIYIFLILLFLFSFTFTGCDSISSLISGLSPAKQTAVNQLEVHFIDVGQGDCEIIRCGDANMIIDAGTNDTAAAVVKTIKKLGIAGFDVAVGTHPHEDHIGGLDAVINNFDIGSIYMPDVSTTTKTYTDVLSSIKNHNLTVTSPSPGTTFNIGEARCTILAPNSTGYDEINDYSIVIRLDYGSTSFLFTGDAQATSEAEMLTAGYNLKTDVLKVGHHGSYTATSTQFLDTVSPQWAVIEVGWDNDYGHPHRETLEKLDAAGVKVYRTDLDGTVVIKSDGSSLSITTSK